MWVLRERCASGARRRRAVGGVSRAADLNCGRSKSAQRCAERRALAGVLPDCATCSRHGSKTPLGPRCRCTRRMQYALGSRASAMKDTSKHQNATCSCLSTVQFANCPKRSIGHVLGVEKRNFLIRGRGRPTVYGGRAGLILSIPVKQVSLGSPRVGTIHVQAPTPHAPALQSFLVDFSQQTTGFGHL